MAETSVCTECGGSVIWKQVAVNGRQRWQCFETNGETIHWDNCSQRRWRQTVASGTRFESAMSSGYANSVHGTRFDRITAPATRKDLPTCRGCVPPWESCPNACPIEFRRAA